MREAAEQQTLIDWARLHQHKIPALRYLHASLNGIRLSPQQARRYKRQGMVAGVPDLCLPFPVAPYHGLYIELKTRTGATSEAQRGFLGYLTEVGYRAVVCRGWIEARDEIVAYLGGGR